MKKCVFRNFEKFKGKRMCQRFFFNKVTGLRPATLLKTRLWHWCFHVNFAKFPRTPFLQNTSKRQPLSSDNFLKMLSVLPEKFCTRFGLDFSGLPTIA